VATGRDDPAPVGLANGMVEGSRTRPAVHG